MAGPGTADSSRTRSRTRSSTELLKVPHTKFVRGMSQFGLSAVYVVFEDNTDLYWARSRVLEYLNGVREQAP